MATRANVTQPVQCRGCGKEIIFIKACSGKTIPCDPEPVYVRQDPKGGTYVMKDGRIVFGELAGDADDDPDANLLEAYVSHFATCPVGGRFRRARKSERRRMIPPAGGDR
ncbi:MAG: hypothetical protein E7325_02280 [Clostridiales bacterium]|nr:hypothetical protein [Clostridiales bacterium]